MRNRSKMIIKADGQDFPVSKSRAADASFEPDEESTGARALSVAGRVINGIGFWAKILSLILCIAMLALGCYKAYTERQITIDGFKYKPQTDGTYTLTGFEGEPTEVEIPGFVNGRAVRIIDRGVFSGCESLESVTVPDSVSYIYIQTFCGCKNLKSVTLPNSIENIADNAFSDCDSLESIKLPEYLQGLGIGAFDDCDALKSIELPDAVREIKLGAFSRCDSLAEITVGDGNTIYTSQDGVLYSNDMTELVCCPAGKSGEFIVPDGVTKIANVAFSGCGKLTSVTVPESVTAIGGGAFIGCKMAVHAPHEAEYYGYSEDEYNALGEIRWVVE